MRVRTKVYFGKVCGKHPELKGERFLSGGSCAGCCREKSQRYHEANRESHLAYGVSYYKDTRELQRAYRHEYYLLNRDSVLAAARDYRQKNRDTVLMKKRQRRKE